MGLESIIYKELRTQQWKDDPIRKRAKDLNIPISREDLQIAKKHKKGCSVSFCQKNTKSNPQWDNTLHSLTNVGQGVEKLEPSQNVGGNVKWSRHFGKQSGSSSRCYRKRKHNIYMLMLKAAVLITEKVGTTQTSIKQLEKKKHVEYPYNEISLGNNGINYMLWLRGPLCPSNLLTVVQHLVAEPLFRPMSSLIESMFSFFTGPHQFSQSAQTSPS